MRVIVSCLAVLATSWASAGVIILKEGTIPTESYHQVLAGKKRHLKVISPTFVTYPDSSWTPKYLVNYLRTADLLLQQCDITIQNPTWLTIVDWDNRDAVKFPDGAEPREDSFKRLSTLPQVAERGLPYVILSGINMNARLDAYTLPTYEPLPADDPMAWTRGMIFMRRDTLNSNSRRMNSWLSSLPKFSALAHELVHALGNVGHDNTVANLLNTYEDNAFSFHRDYFFFGGDGHITPQHCQMIEKNYEYFRPKSH